MGPEEVAVGICAYNEARSIGRSIRSVFSQRTGRFRVKEVIVVSSGSTDGTDDIVRSLQKEHNEIALIRQESREGKNSAINAFLDAKTCGIAVLLNADSVLSSEDSLRSLLEPFRDDDVGMTGGRPIPTNDKGSKVGFADHVIWSMHHNISRFCPKLGELIAFRDIGVRLPEDQQADEPLLRMHMERAGYRCVYVPEATVSIRGPETEEDFLKQRTRINIGECFMKKRQGYADPSWNTWWVVKATFGAFRDLGFHPFKFAYAARMELRARSAARRFVVEGDADMSVWDPVESTKKVRPRTLRPSSLTSPGLTASPSPRTEFLTTAPSTTHPGPIMLSRTSDPSTLLPGRTTARERREPRTEAPSMTTESDSSDSETAAPFPTKTRPWRELRSTAPSLPLPEATCRFALR